MASSSNAQTYETLSRLYQDGDYENVVHRAKKVLRSGENTAVRALFAASLMQSGHLAEALTEAEAVMKDKKLPKTLVDDMTYVRAYSLYGMYRLEEAMTAVKEIRAKSPQNTFAPHLEAQIYCRRGDFSTAVSLYREILEATSKRRRGGWLTGRTVENDPVTKAEIITNLSSSLVSGGRAKEALTLQAEYPQECTTSEILYNLACGMITCEDYSNAKVHLMKARDASVDAMKAESLTEADIQDELAGIRTQLAYIRQILGDTNGAEDDYTDVLKRKPRDSTVAAVAANNLASARWISDNRNLLGLQKRMKMSTGDGVEQKLTNNQRKTMACNRAILLLEMGKWDACKKEIDAMKEISKDFKMDEDVQMIEATMYAREKKFDLAESTLSSGRNEELFSAVLAQVKLEHGDFVGAAGALVRLRSNPAATATAARLYEAAGDVPAADRALSDAAQQWIEENKSGLAMAALKEQAALLLRHKSYAGAIDALEKILVLVPNDEAALAHLVIAASNVNEVKAKEVAKKLPSLPGSDSLDPVELEALPAAKRRERMIEIGSKRSKKAEEGEAVASDGVVKRKKKKKKSKKPKNLDPNAPPPDPERWLPKYMRTGYKKPRRRGGDGGLLRGAQGASLAAVAAASEKMNSNANTSSVPSGPTVPSRPKGAKQKKKRAKK